jgi:ubiquinone/menaquinone biosynthesis C-methylase UbiE
MRVMKDCYRILKEGGVMLSISHGKEKNRRFFYRNRFSPFSLQVVPVGDLKPGQPQIYLYVLTKGEPG